LKISSRDNQKLKHARMVRDAGSNNSENLIFVEGLRLCEEGLRSDLEIETIFTVENFAENERAKRFLEFAATRKSIAFFEIGESVFRSLADTKNSQGVVLIARQPETGSEKIEAALASRDESKNSPLVVLLHQINNPSNLGAILRTAEASGVVAGVIATESSADAFSPKSLRGSMGAAFRLPLWTRANFSEVLQWARRFDLISVAADTKAEKSYLEIDWSKPRLLVFGSEAHGLSAIDAAEIDENLKIPMENAVESLNLAVSCGVILFEAKRQINGKRKTKNNFL
jgi:TrmH family RNA methyltransferase